MMPDEVAMRRSASGLPGSMCSSVESPALALQVSGFLSGPSRLLTKNPGSRLSMPILGRLGLGDRAQVTRDLQAALVGSLHRGSIPHG